MLSQGGVYDRQRQQFEEMNEAMVLAAATQPACPGNIYITLFLNLNNLLHIIFSVVVTLRVFLTQYPALEMLMKDCSGFFLILYWINFKFYVKLVSDKCFEVLCCLILVLITLSYLIEVFPRTTVIWFFNNKT